MEVSASQHKKQHSKNRSQSGAAPKSVPGPKTIVDYNWRTYDPAVQKEINYLKDFLDEHQDKNVCRKHLGLFVEDEPKEKLAARNDFSARLILMNVAENIQNRLSMNGGLDQERNFIKRTKHNNENYYE